MNYEYNRKHVQVSVSAAAILGILLGFWFGKRAETAGILETVVILILFVTLSIVVFSAIDRKLLRPSSEVKSE